MAIFLPFLPPNGRAHGTVPNCRSPLHSRKADAISPLDDLAFDMYQDPEVAQIIRKLDEKKHEAVRQEHYDHAKKLKQAIADLQKVAGAEGGWGRGPSGRGGKGLGCLEVLPFSFSWTCTICEGLFPVEYQRFCLLDWGNQVP